MGLSSRYYLFAEDGVHRIAKRVVEGLVQGIDALPNYAGTTQKAAVVTVENDAKGVARINDAVGEFWHFDKLGKPRSVTGRSLVSYRKYDGSSLRSCPPQENCSWFALFSCAAQLRPRS
jgi:hypothetical protein